MKLTLRRRQAGGGTAQWSELLELRFERLALPAPVIAIRLASGQGEALKAASDTLPFDGKTGSGRTFPVAHLVERLSARMGEAAVHGMMLVDEHRPHCAWRATPALDTADRKKGVKEKGGRFIFSKINLPPFSKKRRPLWLLPEPLPLETIDGEPVYHGPLRRVSGPERIESGWWDAGGIARDYFVASNGEGMRLWIYRECRRTDWYLQGLFG